MHNTSFEMWEEQTKVLTPSKPLESSLAYKLRVLGGLQWIVIVHS